MANQLPTEKKITATAMLCEGNSIRSIERMTGGHREIGEIGVRVQFLTETIRKAGVSGFRPPASTYDTLDRLFSTTNAKGAERGTDCMKAGALLRACEIFSGSRVWEGWEKKATTPQP